MPSRMTPREAYARVALDARVVGAGPNELVELCLDALVEGLDGALHAHRTGDPAGKSKAMARAVAALTGLILGIVPGVPLSSALTLLYGAARREVLDSVVRFDPLALATLRADFSAIRQALRPSGPVPGENAVG